MERLGIITTSLTGPGAGDSGACGFNRDKSLLDENSSFTLTTPLDDYRQQPLLIPNSVENLTADIEIATKPESNKVANEGSAMPIGGGDISSVLDQTLSAAINVSNVLYEDQ